ncbi:hypothetical protein QM565_26640 [Geitlerinema splendidum]|nr:hypothetical protein [Geitlerinema splendidum]
MIKSSSFSLLLVLASPLAILSGLSVEQTLPSVASESVQQSRLFQNQFSQIGTTSLSDKIAFLREKPQCGCARCSQLDTLSEIRLG